MKRIVLSALVLMLAVAVGAKSLKGSRPNIVLVMTDDQGSLLSCMGHPMLQTPNIDRFSKQSLRLTEFHVSPTCAPTRAAIMSGRHEFKNGVTHTVQERERMALTTVTIAQTLQRAGYATGIFGKWHLGDPDPYLPGNRGFSEALTHGAGGIGQLYPGSCADFPPNVKLRYNDPVLLHNDTIVKSKGYCTDIFFASALGWMKQQLDAEKPFFTYLVPNTPHSPLISPEANLKRLKDRGLDLDKNVEGRFGMIENIDDNFGLMMKKLEEWGALENTLVIFTTDNGSQVRDGKARSPWNNGFKTGKGSPGEGGTHVPCFWYWKGILREGDVNALVAHIDLYKTFCDLAGATLADDVQELDGRTLLPLLENTDAKWDDRMLFVHSGRWGKGVAPQRDSRCAVRTQRWRLVGGKLYDIANDPKEDTDVSKQHPEVVERLNAARLKWWDETLPLMINEDRSWDEDQPPLYTRYYKQLEEKGIPLWTPPEL
ncbi:arylsulfatase [Pontiella sulfatireligans]|uniref:Arylsulfatase n=1 Tax=Pontiella sulfatireligans TaxID=2750658 RepID=A0A6C2UFH5_9BACT|nr:arylsulfatase [Pontiella sulfatireligans]SPS74260.1 sulfatase S1_17 [Kiritimatiellales bacterium]VGO18920.1 Arylsulfatase [Pontiella sulfatireligans]